MIVEHTFNTAWWGAAVGVVRDGALFDLPSAQREQELSKWPWVEYREHNVQYDRIRHLHEVGFFHADVQLQFKVRLTNVHETSSTERLTVVRAHHRPFEIAPNTTRPFVHERFMALPTADSRKVTGRYERWASELLRQEPCTCLQVELNGQPQGWFLAKETDKGLNLTLAMLHLNAKISGLHLYRKALSTFATDGHRIGLASFSANNTAVLNIYSQLGARFVGSSHNFLWIRP